MDNLLMLFKREEVPDYGRLIAEFVKLKTLCSSSLIYWFLLVVAGVYPA